MIAWHRKQRAALRGVVKKLGGSFKFARLSALRQVSRYNEGTWILLVDQGTERDTYGGSFCTEVQVTHMHDLVQPTARPHVTLSCLA